MPEMTETTMQVLAAGNLPLVIQLISSTETKEHMTEGVRLNRSVFSSPTSASELTALLPQHIYLFCRYFGVTSSELSVDPFAASECHFLSVFLQPDRVGIVVKIELRSKRVRKFWDLARRFVKRIPAAIFSLVRQPSMVQAVRRCCLFSTCWHLDLCDIGHGWKCHSISAEEARADCGDRCPTEFSSSKTECLGGRRLESMRKNMLPCSDCSLDKSMAILRENVNQRHFTRQLAKLKSDRKRDCKEVTRALKTKADVKAAAQAREESEDSEVRRRCRLGQSHYTPTNQSALFDKRITNTAQAVLQKMDDMEKVRRRRVMVDLRVFHDAEVAINLFYCRNRYDFRERKAVERSRASLKKPKWRKTPYSRQSPPVCQRASSSSRQSQGPCCRRSKRSLPPKLQTDDLQGIHKDRTQVEASLAGADQTDGLVRFDSVGGLSEHISALKEMVVFPLLYPEFFEGFKIQPPRGCIFYGPPGTGKTLVAQALANECRQGDRKVAFFMRKGADCLSKWVGESAQQLRSLFDQAYQMRPSIIFIDEIDGLAPERSSKQDQVYSSIVTTLLTLMDGLNSRGGVVVIGATNRLDSIDPALRRPGRFDRELLFSLPNREARKQIFKIHTQDWSPQPLDSFLDELAEKCVGYCGADIKSLCAEAALCASRRHYPQICQSTEKLQLNMASIKITAQDFVMAMQKIVPASQRVVSSPGRPLTPVLKPLLGNTLARILRALQRAFPHAELALQNREQGPSSVMQEEKDLLSICKEGTRQKMPARPKKEFLDFSRNAYYQPTSYKPRFLLAGEPGCGQTSDLAPAVLHALEKFPIYTLDLPRLLGNIASPEKRCVQLPCLATARIYHLRFPSCDGNSLNADNLQGCPEKFLLQWLVVFHSTYSGWMDPLIMQEAQRRQPSIIYIPQINTWWEMVGDPLKTAFTAMLDDIPAFAPVLLFATSHVCYADLPKEVKAFQIGKLRCSFCIQELFANEEVFQIQLPMREERERFLEDIIVNQAAKVPAVKSNAEVLLLFLMVSALASALHASEERWGFREGKNAQFVLHKVNGIRSIGDARFYRQSFSLERCRDTGNDVSKRKRKNSSGSSGILRKRRNLQLDKENKSPEYQNEVERAVGSTQDSSLEETDRVLQEGQGNGNEKKFGTENERVLLAAKSLSPMQRVLLPEQRRESEMPAYQVAGSSEGEDSAVQAEVLTSAICVIPESRGNSLSGATCALLEKPEAMDAGEGAELTQPGTVGYQKLKVSLSSVLLLLKHNVSRQVLRIATAVTENFSVSLLQKLCAVLTQCIYRHREENDKTQLVELLCYKALSFQSGRHLAILQNHLFGIIAGSFSRQRLEHDGSTHTALSTSSSPQPAVRHGQLNANESNSLNFLQERISELLALGRNHPEAMKKEIEAFGCPQ
ncbi:ATPase family AAA domain-containing protein 2-like [Rhynochetos jubatus]